MEKRSLCSMNSTHQQEDAATYVNAVGWSAPITSDCVGNLATFVQYYNVLSQE